MEELKVKGWSFLISFFIGLSAISQVKDKKIRAIIIEGNGKVAVEDYYPVDSTVLTSKSIWLDSTGQLVDVDDFLNKYYFFEQIEVCDLWQIGRLYRKKPVEFIVDSITKRTKQYELEIEYRRIDVARIIYKKRRYFHTFIIEDGLVQRETISHVKNDKIVISVDFSSLYAEINPKWPQFIVYDDNGEIECIETFYCNRELLTSVSWKKK